MPRDPFRYLIAALLLAAGLIAIRWCDAPAAVITPPTARPATFRYVADIDTWRATDRQSEIFSPYDFGLGPTLRDIPLHVANWSGEDVPERNQEVFLLLEPEQFVKRLYELEDDPQQRYVWLFLIGSRQMKSFHAPDICYAAIDWQTTVGSEAVRLGDGELHVLRILAQQATERQLSLYFFIFPDDSYDESKGTVMLRVASPVWDNEETTLALQEDFLRQLFVAAHPAR